MQKVRLRPALGVQLQVREHFGVAVNQPMKQLGMQVASVFDFRLWAQVLAGNGDECLRFKFIAAREQVRHLLLFIGFVAHVSEDDEASTGRVPGRLGAKGRRGENQRQGNDEDGTEC
jgi:hypothetical protein